MSATTSEGDLVVEDLTVEYANGGYVVRPVDGFSCRVADGSLVLLLGPSGSGKTTLLSCLSGILTPTSGSIRHHGTEVTSLTGAAQLAYRRTGVGIVFQAFNLVPSLSALDNVMLPLRNAGTPRAEAKRRAGDLLSEMGLAERAHHLPGELSGGQQQRVAIARAVALEPPLLLADEPTAHLDYVQVENTLRILGRLAIPGRVVVIVTHDDRLLPLADQVIELVPHRPPHIESPVTRELAPGEVLFDQGDPSNHIYVVESGRIDIVRSSADGGTETIAQRGPDEAFGEMGPLFGLRRSAGARAAEPTTVTGYSVQDFRETLGIERLDGLVRGSVPGLGSRPG